MSSTPPTSPVPPPRSRAAWLPGRRLPWILVAVAFAAGLLLFALVLTGERDDGFFRAGSTTDTATGNQVFEPLPTPDAAGGSSIERGLPPQDTPTPGADARTVEGETPSLDGTPASAPGEPTAPTPTPAADPAGGATASARPVRSPQPVYPVRALRRGEAGTVLLQVDVDASGRPSRVQVVQSSRSRDLDRAAVTAVERWEFSPALRSGQPVPAKVLIPIEFNR